MQLVVAMQVFQSHEQFSNDDCDVILCNHARLHQVRTAPTAAKLHDDPQIRALEVRAIVFRDVRGVEFGKDADLGDDVVDFIFGIFDVDDLDGYGLTRSLVDTARDRGQLRVANQGDFLTLCKLCQKIPRLVQCQPLLLNVHSPTDQCSSALCTTSQDRRSHRWTTAEKPSLWMRRG